jgi:hypothetical protein
MRMGHHGTATVLLMTHQVSHLVRGGSQNESCRFPLPASSSNCNPTTIMYLLHNRNIARFPANDRSETSCGKQLIHQLNLTPLACVTRTAQHGLCRPHCNCPSWLRSISTLCFPSPSAAAAAAASEPV